MKLGVTAVCSGTHVEAKRPPFSLILAASLVKSCHAVTIVVITVVSGSYRSATSGVVRLSVMSSTTTSTTGAQSHRRLGHSLPTVCCLGGQQSPKSRLRRRVEPLRQLPGVALHCLAHVTAVQVKLPQPIVALPHPSFEWHRRGCWGVCVAARSRLGHFCFCFSPFTAARQDFLAFFVLFNGFAIFSASHPWDARRQ